MKLSLYRMATTLGGPLIRLYLNKRLKRGKEDAARFEERLGIASLPRPDGRLVWIHAASVGESLSVLTFIDRVQKDYPDTSILVTTGTLTSARLMAKRLPQGAVHQYVPADCVSYVRRFLEHWKPDLAFWVESEFWPNMVIETRARAVPMVVLNGRMSQSSYEGWRKSRAMIGRILSAFPLVLAQSDTDGLRFQDLGAKAVDVPGNLKYASAPLPYDEAELTKLKSTIGERPVWLASSTHPGEETIAGRAHKTLRDKLDNPLTIIVPRHPERGSEIADDLKASGLNVALRSIGDDLSDQTDVYIADTLGELGIFYRLCSVVFIGKTLAGSGGQNPIEPAQLGCALIFGPDMSNFEDASALLSDAGGAHWVANEGELTNTLEDLMTNEQNRTNAAQQAQDAIASEAQVLERVMTTLTPYLKGDHDARI
ncbi:3-deoxy-D-manno-octulosonic acid transferase [Magnetovibrio sp. PR-2]|uniref:3-deoxy-D-manno-octulosonic acid transferase n=1 Tax=Magnetovibrio sp. PR-2 TaxID=3120356 RepID=UPI002FCE64D7